MNSIFISSSFKDMLWERDAIRRFVLPEVNDFLRTHYGQETALVDLRWGIDTQNCSELESMTKVVRTCLMKINDCKPFVIVLLGDRYGSIIEEKQLRRILSDTDRFKIQREIGVTELEIRYSLHLAETEQMHVLFYFRDMDYSTVPESEYESIFFDRHDKHDKRAKQETLKQELQKHHPQLCRHYSAAWDAEQRCVTGLNNLCLLIVDDVKACVRQDLGEQGDDSFLRSDRAFVRTKQSAFIGRENELQKIKEFIQSEQHDVALLLGGAGTGKSALMANLPELIGEGPYYFCPVFCGQSIGADTAVGVMRVIVMTLCEFLRKEPPTRKHLTSYWDANRWHQEMDTLISQIVERDEKALVILIDGIDQMVQDLYSQKFFFLPYTHEGKVKIIISSTDDHPIEYALPSLEHSKVIHLENPDKQTIEAAIEKTWESIGRPSVSEQVNLSILAKPLSHNYLYLNLLMTRLSIIGADVFAHEHYSEKFINDQIEQIILHFPDSLEAAAKELLSALGKEINGDFAEKLFTYLQLSENGVRISDWQTLLGDSFQEADFFYLKKLLGTLLFEREDHRFDFSHKVFRDISFPEDREKCQNYLLLAESLHDDDPLKIQYWVRACVLTKEYGTLCKTILRYADEPQNANALAQEIAKIIESDANLPSQLAAAFPMQGHLTLCVRFVNEYLYTFLPPSKAAKLFLDSISDACYSESNSYGESTEEELEQIAEFEKKRFDIQLEYWGYSYCESDRYLQCLMRLYTLTGSDSYLVKALDFRLDYEEYWDPFTESYDLTQDRFSTKRTLQRVADEAIQQTENKQSMDWQLLRAKAFVRKADCQYAASICFINDEAEENLSTANAIIDKVADSNAYAELSRTAKIHCMQVIADIYLIYGKIYMRVNREGRLSDSMLCYELYSRAEGFLSTARHILMIGKAALKDVALRNKLLDCLCYEIRICCYNRDICSDEVESIEATARSLIDDTEKNIYLLSQSQYLCSQYAQLCAMKADLIRSRIPQLSNWSDSREYPWSMLKTKGECLQMVQTLKDVDRLCDRVLYLLQYLVSINPTPGNFSALETALQNRLHVFDNYSYHSRETINTLKDIRIFRLSFPRDNSLRDGAYGELRKIPVILSVCELMRRRKIDEDYEAAIYILAAVKALRIISMYKRWDVENYLDQFSVRLDTMVSLLVEYTEYALEHSESLAFSVFSSECSTLKFAEIDNKKEFQALDKRIQKKLKEPRELELSWLFSDGQPKISEWKDALSM